MTNDNPTQEDVRAMNINILRNFLDNGKITLEEYHRALPAIETKTDYLLNFKA